MLENILANILPISFLFGTTLLPITISILYFRSVKRPKKYGINSRNKPDHWSWQIVELFTSRE